MGPMVAGARFLDVLRAAPFRAHGLRASLHGSLAFTGKGHATDRAVILGLLGFRPETLDPDEAERRLAALREDVRGPGPDRHLAPEIEAAVRAVAERALTRQGYTVITAENGEAALERLAAMDAAPDMLIMHNEPGIKQASTPLGG